MGGSALSTAPEEMDMAHRRTDGSRADSPAIRLLDALRNGDDDGVLAVCGDTTIVTAENMRWSCQGRDEIHRWLAELRQRFPGLDFDSRTRHIGFGLVIDEARVRDVGADAPEAGLDHEVDQRVDDPSAKPVETPSVQAAEAGGHRADIRADVRQVGDADHPMWDEPVTEERNVQRMWAERGEEAQPATALNMPVRVTVRHDDLQVHEVLLSFPAALFKRALGLKVDPLEMSLSEVQSAFIAPVGAGFTTYALARPELAHVSSPHVDQPEPATAEPRRRRGRVLVPLLMVLALLAAGGAWWATQARDGSTTAGGPTPSPSPSASPSSSPSASPGTQPTRKPNLTLTNDLAFGFNSSTLSTKAKAAIATVATQVRRAGLTGTIYVYGYTDNIGSAAYGKVLSQRRAQVVADYLTSRLGSADVTVVATGFGEADPVASNATAAGRQANRRVTITLPKS